MPAPAIQSPQPADLEVARRVLAIEAAASSSSLIASKSLSVRPNSATAADVSTPASFTAGI